MCNFSLDHFRQLLVIFKLSSHRIKVQHASTTIHLHPREPRCQTHPGDDWVGDWFRRVEQFRNITIKVKNFGGVITAAYIFLVVTAHRVFIEQGDFVVDQILAIHVAVGEGLLGAIGIDTEAGPLVDWIVRNVDHLIRRSGPRIVKPAQDLSCLGIEIQHDFPRNESVADALVRVLNLPALADIHPQQTKYSPIRFPGHPRVAESGPFKNLR